MNPKIYPLTIYYDGACSLCNAEMTNLMLRNHDGHLRFENISAPGFKAFPQGTVLADLLELIHAERADGAVIKGVDVFRLAYAAVGLGWVARVASLPVISILADKAYPVLARNRHRLPRGLIHWVFQTSIRRAAEKAAARRCTSEGNCRI